MATTTVTSTIVEECIKYAKRMDINDLIKIIGKSDAEIIKKKNVFQCDPAALVQCSCPLKVFEKLLKSLMSKYDQDSDEKKVVETPSCPIFRSDMIQQWCISIKKNNNADTTIAENMKKFWERDTIFITDVSKYVGGVDAYVKYAKRMHDKFPDEVKHIHNELRLARLVCTDEEEKDSTVSIEMARAIAFRGKVFYTSLLESPELITFIEY